MEEGSTRAVVAALAANLGIAVAKLVAFLLTGSASMLAELVHSVADTGNQGLLFLGGHQASAPPDDRHPFGHSSERYFWAFVVALVLFTLGSLFALDEGISKLIHPHQPESPIIAIGVLGVSVVLESFSLRTARREAQHDRRRGEGLLGFVRRTKNPELAVVLLEDSGALCGLAFALVGIILAEVTGQPRWDALGSTAIGLLLGAIAILLAVEMKSLLIGEAAEPEVIEALRAAIDDDEKVLRLIHLRTLQLGPADVLVAAKIELVHELDLSAIAAEIDRIEVRIRDAVPAARLVFLEPDVSHGDRI
jgi:cation diffusion facilitator family transporter